MWVIKVFSRQNKSLWRENSVTWIKLTLDGQTVLEQNTEMGDNEFIIKENMEQVVKLSVPLVAEVGMGKNWREAH